MENTHTTRVYCSTCGYSETCEVEKEDPVCPRCDSKDLDVTL